MLNGNALKLQPQDLSRFLTPAKVIFKNCFYRIKKQLKKENIIVINLYEYTAEILRLALFSSLLLSCITLRFIK